MTNLPKGKGPSSPLHDSVPLLDVNRGNEPLNREILEAISRVCESGRFLHGPDVRALEESIAQVCQTRHAIGCASGSDALLLSLMALDIGPGDEVIVPSFTFFATASAVWRVGAKIVFADIDSATYNLDPSSVESAITPATRAIIPVHLFGQCADMESFDRIANEHDLHVIEDAAQSLGARRHGCPAGSFGDVGCFSFYPTKNLGGYGDGGMLTTNDDQLAQRLRLFAAHGMENRYYHSVVGINSRLDSIQAATLNVKVQHLRDWSYQRRSNAVHYETLFSQLNLNDALRLPSCDVANEHVWNQYTIRVPNGMRDALVESLREANIGAAIYYPVPLHLQKCFAGLGYTEGSLPETERATEEVLSLPIFPELTASEQRTVVNGIRSFLDARRDVAA